MPRTASTRRLHSGTTLRLHTHLRLLARPLQLCLLVSAVSCGGSASGPSATVAYVTVAAPGANIAVGHTAQLSAVAFDETGAQLIGVTFEWSSSDQSIATVSSTGVVTGVALGSARISAKTGTVSGFTNVTIGPTMTTLRTEKPIARG